MYHSNTVFISIHSSAKPETSVDLLGPLIIVISIHSSAKPETHRLRPQGSQWNISIHSSAKPETGKSGGETMNLIISIHSSAKPETLERSIFLYNREFQSTPARSRRLGIRLLHTSPGYFNPLQREAGDGNYYQFPSIFYTFPYTNQLMFYILHPIPPPIPLSQCAFSSANPLRN